MHTLCDVFRIQITNPKVTETIVWSVFVCGVCIVACVCVWCVCLCVWVCVPHLGSRCSPRPSATQSIKAGPLRSLGPTPLLFEAGWCSMLWTPHILFVCVSVHCVLTVLSRPCYPASQVYEGGKEMTVTLLPTPHSTLGSALCTYPLSPTLVLVCSASRSQQRQSGALSLQLWFDSCLRDVCSPACWL